MPTCISDVTSQEPFWVTCCIATSSQCSWYSMQNPSQYLLYLSYPFICPSLLFPLCAEILRAGLCLPLAKFSADCSLEHSWCPVNVCIKMNGCWDQKKGETNEGGREGSREEKSRSLKPLVINWSFDPFFYGIFWNSKIFALFSLSGSQLFSLILIPYCFKDLPDFTPSVL